MRIEAKVGLVVAVLLSAVSLPFLAATSAWLGGGGFADHPSVLVSKKGLTTVYPTAADELPAVYVGTIVFIGLGCIGLLWIVTRWSDVSRIARWMRLALAGTVALFLVVWVGGFLGLRDWFLD